MPNQAGKTPFHLTALMPTLTDNSMIRDEKGYQLHELYIRINEQRKTAIYRNTKTRNEK